LGRGDPVVVPPLHLREADEVGRELVRASERLHERERTLAVVSHDLRSPLGGLMMGASAVERLAAQLPEGEPIRALAASLVDMTRRMSGMVDDLLAIAVATGGGRSMLNIAPMSAASLLKRAGDAVQPLFAGRDIELEIETFGPLPDVRVDSDRMLRVFANLVDNALKFTGSPGCVVLRAKAESAGVRFSVANSGPALSAVELERMFQPFWQAGREDQSGAGLGLAICRSIIEAHGGHIWAEPEPGKRVRICFVLPVPAGISTRIGSGRGVALRDVVPVDDVEQVVHVLGPPVLVLEVIGVLEDIDHEQRNDAPRRLLLMVLDLQDHQLPGRRMVAEQDPSLTPRPRPPRRELRFELA
jgi:signal transduction histidine kinase